MWLVEFSDTIGLNKARVVIASAWVSPRKGGVEFVAPWFVEPPQDDVVKATPEDAGDKNNKDNRLPDFRKAMRDLGVFHLSGPYLESSSNSVKSLVEKEYLVKSAEKMPRVGTSCPKIVKLPFSIDGFCEVGDLLWQVDITSISDTTDPLGVLASAWVNPKSGELVFYNAPWYVEAPKQMPPRLVMPPR